MWATKVGHPVFLLPSLAVAFSSVEEWLWAWTLGPHFVSSNSSTTTCLLNDLGQLTSVPQFPPHARGCSSPPWQGLSQFTHVKPTEQGLMQALLTSVYCFKIPRGVQKHCWIFFSTSYNSDLTKKKRFCSNTFIQIKELKSEHPQSNDLKVIIAISVAYRRKSLRFY